MQSSIFSRKADIRAFEMRIIASRKRNQYLSDFLWAFLQIDNCKCGRKYNILQVIPLDFNTYCYRHCFFLANTKILLTITVLEISFMH